MFHTGARCPQRDIHALAFGHVAEEAVPQDAAIRLPLGHRMAFDPALALGRMDDAILGPPGRQGAGRGRDRLAHVAHVARVYPRSDIAVRYMYWLIHSLPMIDKAAPVFFKAMTLSSRTTASFEFCFNAGHHPQGSAIPTSIDILSIS